MLLKSFEDCITLEFLTNWPYGGNGKIWVTIIVTAKNKQITFGQKKGAEIKRRKSTSIHRSNLVKLDQLANAKMFLYNKKTVMLFALDGLRNVLAK